jgi:hypothetical protein
MREASRTAPFWLRGAVRRAPVGRGAKAASAWIRQFRGVASSRRQRCWAEPVMSLDCKCSIIMVDTFALVAFAGMLDDVGLPPHPRRGH